MDRRHLLVLAVAAVAGTVLVVRGAPGDEPPPADPLPAGPATARHLPTVPPELPSPVTGPAPPTAGPQPTAVTAAEEFARAWVSTDPRWPASLAELATPGLAEALAEVDPAAVPARAVIGPGSVVTEVPGWVSVGVPTDTGTVVLHVVAVDDGWLVSAIDWRPRW